MLQSTGWKKGFGHNQQGTTSPMEVSFTFPSERITLLQAGGVSQESWRQF